jgi:hypothetical protein
MTDIGVLSFTWGELFDGWPVVVVPQLWCFRDLDPAGTWIDAAQLTLTPDSYGIDFEVNGSSISEGVNIAPRAPLGIGESTGLGMDRPYASRSGINVGISHYSNG